MASAPTDISSGLTVADVVENAQLAEVALARLIDRITPIFSSDHVKLVERSYAVAHKAHANQTRSSGEPYITHPIAVAHIVLDMQLDHPSVMAALLHVVRCHATRVARSNKAVCVPAPWIGCCQCVVGPDARQ